MCQYLQRDFWWWHKYEDWLSDCNWTRTQNHLVRKQTLNHLTNYRVWIQSETRTWHGKNIQRGLIIPKLNEAFKVDKSYFKPERIFDRQPYFPKISRNQRQTCKIDKQESKKLAEKVSIGKHNDCSLIVPIDVLYSDVENFEGGKLKY